MADPVRWLAEGSDAPPGARALLSAADPLPDIPASLHQTSLGYATQLGATKASLWTSAVGAKTIAGAAVVVAASALPTLGLSTVHTESTAPDEIRAAPAVAAGVRPKPTSQGVARSAPASKTDSVTSDAPVLQLEDLEPAEVEGVFAPSVERPIRRSTPSGARQHGTANRPTASLSAEAALLDDAYALLSRDPRTALDRIREYRARYPEGQLDSAAEVVRLEALERLGQPDAARGGGEPAVRENFHGLYAHRIRQLMGTAQSGIAREP